MKLGDSKQSLQVLNSLALRDIMWRMEDLKNIHREFSYLATSNSTKKINL